ncbi:alpha/beta-hydrolase [Trametes coccinea BRFM310]|uniref:Alpha/beta-hydrolase n=1 Tax=Trametes coccinea (strain BRFM310) TaxID=1353009 RepID=A0A1Y2I8H9_TRAC3|nr:alpha/beta-hydrolase [Trametes coccinea BRFM310]
MDGSLAAHRAAAEREERKYMVADMPSGPRRSTTPSSRARFVKLVLFLCVVIVTVGFQLGLLPSGPGSSELSRVRAATKDFDWYALEPSRNIQWTPCYSGQQCARLLLPLDYDTPDGPTTAVALRMIPATDRKNYKGTLLVNPGGPGGSGTSFIARAGANISHVVGGSFDILGFDPRGIGATTPAARCFETDSQRKLWELQGDSRILNLTDGSVDIARAREKLVAARCEEKIGGEWGIARFAGTHLVARDMLEIVERLGQEKLQYWGFSYGTVLGQYFAAMYPDKVGRLIIDGVFDAYSYRANIWDTSLVDTDTVIGSFFHFCHQAGPDKCTLWEPTAAEIQDRYLKVLNAVGESPVPIPLADPPLVLTRKHLQAQMFQASYKPLSAFGLVADTILAIETRNQTALATLAPRIADPTECNCSAAPEPWRADSEAMRAIECGDGDEEPFDADAFTAFYTRLLALSPLSAPIWAANYLACAEWRVRPHTRYLGPFAAARTAHPLLLVSPRFDPVCPLADARAVHGRFGGAGLLVQNSYGHCSLAAPSLCTARHVRAYMENGTLPEPGTVCEPDELPFVGRVEEARARVLSVEDLQLLEAMRGLSKEFELMPGPR